MDNIITSDDILGKHVIDEHGDVVGVSQKLHIDKNKKNIVGISVDQGFMKPDLFVGLEYIEQFGVDTIFLNTFPKDKVIGMAVIDAYGREVGTVKTINFSSKNVLISINVKGQGKNLITIHSSKIREIGYNVILKEEFKE